MVVGLGHRLVPTRPFSDAPPPVCYDLLLPLPGPTLDWAGVGHLLHQHRLLGLGVGGCASVLLAYGSTSLPFAGGRSPVAPDLTLDLGGCRVAASALVPAETWALEPATLSLSLVAATPLHPCRW